MENTDTDRNPTDSQNPLLPHDPAIWDWLIDSVGPPSMLIAIQHMMGAELKAVMTADDVWQETLLHAWRDRHSVAWQGVRAFRRWLLEIARNRVRDLADRAFAHKRGGRMHARSLPPTPHSTRQAASLYAGPIATTTPSRAAADAELAAAMEAALAVIPEELREVVRLRLFEDETMGEIAGRLGLGVEAVRHRFRRGAALYRSALRKRIDSTTVWRTDASPYRD